KPLFFAHFIDDQSNINGVNQFNDNKTSHHPSFPPDRSSRARAGEGRAATGLRAGLSRVTRDHSPRPGRGRNQGVEALTVPAPDFSRLGRSSHRKAEPS